MTKLNATQDFELSSEAHPNKGLYKNRTKTFY